MIKIRKKSIIVLLSLLFFSACGGGDTSSTTSTSGNNTTLQVTINDDTLTRAAVKVDDLIVQVHNTSFETTSALYTTTNTLLSDATRMSQSVTDRMDAEMKLLNILAKPFAIAANYSSYFSENKNYNALTPAFIINKPLTNNYFLVSSESKFYLQGQTIKTFFKDSTTLATAWSRAIINANKSKNLYISLLELNSNGKTTQVTNSFVIKSNILKTY